MRFLRRCDGSKRTFIASVFTDCARMSACLCVIYSCQRKKLLPLLKSESRDEMEKILDGYKWTHKLNVRLFLSQKLKEENRDGEKWH